MGDRNRARPSSNNQVSSSKNFRMNKSDTSPKSLPARQNSNPKSMNPNRQEKRNSLIRNEVQDWSGHDGGGSSSERKNSSKKVNMNHLLNCTVKTREDTNGRAFTKNPDGYVKRPPINYVRTHGQTLLRKNSAFTPKISALNADPNLHVDWKESVAAVRFFEAETDKIECAICLDKPIAPRSTRCGHVFCFPCILHHFAVLNDGNEKLKISAWHKCPICHKEVLKRKLKLATISKELARVHKPEIGKNISFELMNRKKGTIFAKVGSEDQDDIDFGSSKLSFSESCFGIINLQQELDILLEDLESLNVNVAMADKLEIPFYREAVNLVKEGVLEIESRRQCQKESDDTKHDGFEKSADADECYQYYQTSNTRMFLHPINNRCLIEEFLNKSVENKSVERKRENSSSSFKKNNEEEESSAEDNQEKETTDEIEVRCLPGNITGKVVEFETFQVYEDIAKKFKFLNHLPEGTTVYLVEVDLKSMHVQTKFKDTNKDISQLIQFSREAMKKVKPAIDKRRKLRNERKREEQSYEQKYLESQMEELYLFDDSQFSQLPTNHDPDFYDNSESFPGQFEPESPQQDYSPPTYSATSSSSLASQMKMGMSLNTTAYPAPASFGFASKMRNPGMTNPGMSLLPEASETKIKTGPVSHRPGAAKEPPSCVQFVVKTKKQKGGKKKHKIQQPK